MLQPRAPSAKMSCRLAIVMTLGVSSWQVIDLGRTEVPAEIRQEFLLDLSDRYMPENYSLLHNNCNNFRCARDSRSYCAMRASEAWIVPPVTGECDSVFRVVAVTGVATVRPVAVLIL